MSLESSLLYSTGIREPTFAFFFCFFFGPPLSKGQIILSAFTHSSYLRTEEHIKNVSMRLYLQCRNNSKTDTRICFQCWQKYEGHRWCFPGIVCQQLCVYLPSTGKDPEKFLELAGSEGALGKPTLDRCKARRTPTDLGCQAHPALYFIMLNDSCKNDSAAVPYARLQVILSNSFQFSSSQNPL